MLDDLEALIALREHGTMTKAATALRLSQSAISKRITALGSELGIELLRPVGRRVQLTPFAAELVERTAPLLSELRVLIRSGRSALSGELPIAVSESVLASWGPRLLARVQSDVPGVRFSVAAHRSPVAIDLARSGEVMLALVAGQAEGAADLAAHTVGHEPMVVVTAPGSSNPRKDGRLSVMAIEPHAATWQSVESRLRRMSELELEITATLQSFAALTQMARAGFGAALVPLGIAQAMRVGRGNILAFPGAGLTRPISVIGRIRTFDGALVSAVSASLERHAGAAIPDPPRETL